MTKDQELKIDEFLAGYAAGIEAVAPKWRDMRLVYPPEAKSYLTFDPLFGISIRGWSVELLAWNCGVDDYAAITHWMALPEAPE